MTKGKPEFVGGGDGPIKFKLPGSPLRNTIIGVSGILLLALVFMYFSFLEYVRPNEFGIKEIQIGLDRGIQENVYPPGYALVIPKLQIIHRLPRSLQVLEMSGIDDSRMRTAALPSDAVRHTEPANIQTSDGFFVTVDATILYRIEDAYKVVTKLGPDDGYFTEGINPKALPKLKDALGQLTTEEFYDSTKRVAKAELARQLLDEDLDDYGIAVEHVLVRYFKYTESIQANIEEKKLQDQMVFKNQSKQKAAEAQQALNKAIVDGEKAVTLTLQNGEAFKIERKAEEDLYVRTKTAEADLMVALAEAEAKQLENEALQVEGVDRKVALQMAEVLRGIELIILPSGGEGSLNPLDLTSTIDLFGVALDQQSAPALAPPAAPAPTRPAPAYNPPSPTVTEIEEEAP